MIYHFVVGDEAAIPLMEAVAGEPSMAGEVVVLRDILHVGPLQKEAGQSFSDLRSAWWQEVAPNEKAPVRVDDTERVLEVSAQMYKDGDTQAWMWMAPWPADVCAYHWLIKYLSKHAGRFYLVNIANLPFLNEAGKVYYPRNISEILPRELVKARRLARPVTPAEVEVDGEEWSRIVALGGGIRTHEGGKKLAAQDDHFYDDRLISCCSQQFQKASRIIHAALTRYNIPTGDSWLAWRLRRLADQGLLQLKGDVSKTFRDWEAKLPGGAEEVPVNAPETAVAAG